MLNTVYKPGHALAHPSAHINRRCISRCRVLDLETPVKITLTLAILITTTIALLVLQGAGLLIGTLLSLIPLTGAVLALRAIWMHVQATTCAPLARGLDDEIRDIVKTYKRLLSVRSLLPEGAGSREKIDEYGRLAFHLFQECDRLPEDMSGRDKNFYRVQNQIQTEMQKLIDSGDELVDLVSTRRAENTLHSVQNLGISQYAEHVSLETMAYRSLTTGDDQKDTKDVKKIIVGGDKNRPIAPRPRGDSVRGGAMGARYRGSSDDIDIPAKWETT